MNEITSTAPWHDLPVESWTNNWHHHYSVESFGMMIGFIAVGLSVGCAAVAAVNAAIICYLLVRLPPKKPAMEGQALISMLALFLAFSLSSLSAILVSTKFDLPFTIGLSILFAAVAVLALFQVQLQAQVLTNWKIEVARQPLNTVAFLVASAVLMIDGVRLYSAVWITLLLWSGTTGYFIMAAVCEKEKEDVPLYIPRGFQIGTLILVAVGWVGYSVMRATWYPKDVPKIERVIPFVVLALGSLVGTMLAIIAWWEWRWVLVKGEWVPRYVVRLLRVVQIQVYFFRSKPPNVPQAS